MSKAPKTTKIRISGGEREVTIHGTNRGGVLKDGLIDIVQTIVREGHLSHDEIIDIINNIKGE